MKCYEIIETHRSSGKVNVLGELHCEEEKIKAEFAQWASWLSDENNPEAIDLWEEMEWIDELEYFVYDGMTYSFRLKPAPAPAIYRLPCSSSGLDSEVDNCDPPAIIAVVEADDPMSAGCVDRYLTTDGLLIDCSIDSLDFALWFDLDELEELEENE